MVRGKSVRPVLSTLAMMPFLSVEELIAVAGLPERTVRDMHLAPNPARDQRTRILETMIDLQVAIEGCAGLQGTYN